MFIFVICLLILEIYTFCNKNIHEYMCLLILSETENQSVKLTKFRLFIQGVLIGVV